MKSEFKKLRKRYFKSIYFKAIYCLYTGSLFQRFLIALRFIIKQNDSTVRRSFSSFPLSTKPNHNHAYILGWIFSILHTFDKESVSDGQRILWTAAEIASQCKVHRVQKRIRNPVKHSRWGVLQKQLTAFNS